MTQQYPRSWDWANEQPQRPLSHYASAPASIGFYELGFNNNGVFEPQYARLSYSYRFFKVHL